MSQKKTVSLRLSESDLTKLKDISIRLGVKESDFLRFTVKQSLAKLMAFRDQDAKGVDLIPALIECGSELTHYLELDSSDLERIVNSGLLDQARKVDPEDLDILVSAGIAAPYMSFKNSELRQVTSHNNRMINSLKDYLYEKYLNINQKESGSKGNNTMQSCTDSRNKFITIGDKDYAIS